MLDTLRAYVPDAQRPWDRVRAGHLLRRAGFAASEEEMRAALDAGPTATVERLLSDAPESERHDDLDSTGKALALRDNIAALRGWWLLRMCHTSRPLHARMALFWHNHFATSNLKVRSAAMMLQQLRTFEQHALVSFDEMLRAISRDPAMIVWLDGNENAKGRPNENYARELFELFSLGVGHYSEPDIKQAARAFTGWHERSGRFRFAAREHDDGEKTVFGRRGNFDGDDIVRLALQQPAASAFLAEKLLHEFVCPQPPAELIARLAAVLRESAFNLKATLRILLSSEAFFDPRWYRARIKSPVEIAVGVVRSLDVRVSADSIVDATSQAGQRLFEPPSVKGWDGHRAWLNSATMLVRLNAASAAVLGERFSPGQLRARHDLRTRDAVVAFCEKLALDERVPEGIPAHYGDESDLDSHMRSVLRVLLTSPEYQMA